MKQNIDILRLNIRHDIYPARGRKQISGINLIVLFSTVHSPRYLPRKGTETKRMAYLLHNWSPNSPRYLPRKGTETLGNARHDKLQISIRHDIYPARGRKHIILFRSSKISLHSPRYLPRKGTETHVCFCHSWQSSDRNSPRYLPRKGTETTARIPN